MSLHWPVNAAAHGTVYAVLAFALGAQVEVSALFSVAVAAVLIWISIADFERFEIPDAASALLAVLGLITVLLRPSEARVLFLATGILWPVIFAGVAFGYRKWRGNIGLGLGDVKLMVGLGFLCGPSGTISLVLAASLGGILTMLVFAAWRRKPIEEIAQSAVAFGPFLCLSGWSVWVSGATG